MKNKLFASSIFAASTLAASAALPSSPLTSEYTINGAETLTDSAYVINSGGVLNIGSDANGAGALNINYSNNAAYLSGSGGIINVGTANTMGELVINGSNSAIPSEQYKQIVSYWGTINVAEQGTMKFSGYIPSSWGQFVNVTTLNLKGNFLVERAAASNSYIQITNLNIYENASFTSEQNLRTVWGGTWNFYTDQIYAKLRIGDTSGSNSTLRVHAANAINNITNFAYDTSNVTYNMFFDYNDQIMNELDLGDKANVNMTFAKDGGKFLINNLSTKNYIKNYTATFNLKNFENDTLFISNDNSNLEITEDNKLYLKGQNAFVDLVAYTGTTDDTLIDGQWSLVWNEEVGSFALNNSAIPEPSTLAAMLGALALGLALYRRGK